MELPKAELKSTTGVKLEAKLKRFWLVYFAISVIFLGYITTVVAVPVVLSFYNDSPASGIISRVTRTTEADNLRNKMAEYTPKRRKENWDSIMYFIRSNAERGEDHYMTEINGFGNSKNSPDMKWFVSQLEKEGIKYVWEHPDIEDSTFMTLRW